AFQPLRTHLGGAVDQVGSCAHAVAQGARAVGVGAVGAADVQYRSASAGQLLDCVLAVLGGVADVVLARAFDGREVLAQRVDDFGGVVHGQGGLGDKGQAVGILHLQTGDVVLVFHQVDGAAIAGVVLPHGAFHLRVSGVA